MRCLSRARLNSHDRLTFLLKSLENIDVKTPELDHRELEIFSSLWLDKIDHCDTLCVPCKSGLFIITPILRVLVPFVLHIISFKVGAADILNELCHPTICYALPSWYSTCDSQMKWSQSIWVDNPNKWSIMIFFVKEPKNKLHAETFKYFQWVYQWSVESFSEGRFWYSKNFWQKDICTLKNSLIARNGWQQICLALLQNGVSEKKALLGVAHVWGTNAYYLFREPICLLKLWIHAKFTPKCLSITLMNLVKYL